METLLANLGQVQSKTLNGREYLVAPVTMIVADRVLNGSQGSLFYPKEEVSRDVGVWNGIPITHNHPHDNGTNVSARSPEIAEKFQIGQVYNDRYENGKRVADGWFDVKLTQTKAPAIYKALTSKSKMELSTGLFTDNEAVNNGKAPDGSSYQYIARNYKPDHLAILPNQKGACSREMGCGLMVNGLCENCGGEGGTMGPCPTGEKRPEHVPLGVGTSVTIKPGSGSFSGTKGKIVTGPHTMNNGKTNVYRVKTKSGRVLEYHVDALTINSNPDDVSVVNEDKKSLWRRLGEALGLVENESKVITNQEEPKMKREDTIQYLTANCDCWKGKEEVLANEDSFTDEDLTKLANGVKTATHNSLVVNAVTKEFGDDFKTLTTNAIPAFLAKKMKGAAAPAEGDDETEEGDEGGGDDSMNLPIKGKKPIKNEEVKMDIKAFETMIENSPEAKAVWNVAKRVEKEERQSLIRHLVSNVRDADRKKELIDKFSDPKRFTLNDLEDLVACQPPVVRNVNTPAPKRKATFLSPHNESPVVNEFSDDDVLDIPVLNFSKQTA